MCAKTRLNMEKPVQMSDFIHKGSVITVGKMNVYNTACGKQDFIAVHKRLIWLNFEAKDA